MITLGRREKKTPGGDTAAVIPSPRARKHGRRVGESVLHIFERAERLVDDGGQPTLLPAVKTFADTGVRVKSSVAPGITTTLKPLGALHSITRPTVEGSRKKRLLISVAAISFSETAHEKIRVETATALPRLGAILSGGTGISEGLEGASDRGGGGEEALT